MSATVLARPALYGTLTWLAAATVVGLTGVLGGLRFGPQLLALRLTVVAVVLVLVGLATTLPRGVLLAWNVFGMLDLIVAVGTATFVVVRGDVPGMQPLLRLPLILVPIFAVPLLFATHVSLFRRLRAPTQ